MHESQSSIRVGMVDDHKLFLDLSSSALNEQAGIAVVATADSVTEAKRVLNPLELDVVVLDIELPDGNGIGLGLTLRRQNPDLGVVLLSAREMLDLLDTFTPAERKGWSYLSKTATTSASVVADVIRAAHRGESVIDPSLMAGSSSPERSAVQSLTPRQFEVLQAVAEGLSNQAVADKLGIAANSVGNHLIAIYAALGIDEGQNARVSAVLAFLSDQRMATTHSDQRD